MLEGILQSFLLLWASSQNQQVRTSGFLAPVHKYDAVSALKMVLYPSLLESVNHRLHKQPVETSVSTAACPTVSHAPVSLTSRIKVVSETDFF